MKYVYIEIKDFKNQKVAKRIDVTKQSEKRRDTIDNGMNRNLNHSLYYTVFAESETELEIIN